VPAESASSLKAVSAVSAGSASRLSVWTCSSSIPSASSRRRSARCSARDTAAPDACRQTSPPPPSPSSSRCSCAAQAVRVVTCRSRARRGSELCLCDSLCSASPPSGSAGSPLRLRTACSSAAAALPAEWADRGRRDPDDGSLSTLEVARVCLMLYKNYK